MHARATRAKMRDSERRAGTVTLCIKTSRESFGRSCVFVFVVVVILQIELGLGDALVPAAGASGGDESTRGDEDKDGRRRGDASDAEVRQ